MSQDIQALRQSADLSAFMDNLEGCRVLRQDAHKTLCAWPAEGPKIFLKIYTERPPASLATLIKGSRAERDQRASAQLASLGISVPRCLGTVVRRTGLTVRSLYAADWIGEAQTLGTHALRLKQAGKGDSEETRAVLANLGRFLARLHDLKVYAMDLNSGNMFIIGQGIEQDFMMVDMESVSFLQSIPLKKRLANLAQLGASMQGLLQEAPLLITASYIAHTSAALPPDFSALVKARTNRVYATWEARVDEKFRAARARARSKDHV